MKKCRSCSKTATLHITELREEMVHEVHLCEHCYREYMDQNESLDDDDDAAITVKLANEKQLEELDRLICPNCEITFREFRNQGRLGCPHDYVAFEDEMLPLLESIHESTQHLGKLPKYAPESSQQQVQLIRLRKELQTAVASEAYEDAATLRDDITGLEAQLRRGGQDADAGPAN